MIKGYNIYIYYNMDEVFKQAPDGLTYEEVETIFIRNDNNDFDNEMKKVLDSAKKHS